MNPRGILPPLCLSLRNQDGRATHGQDVHATSPAACCGAILIVSILVFAGQALAAGGAATNPLMDVPAGQILVVHIPDAARVMSEIDRLLQITHQAPSANLLRREIRKLALAQELHADSMVTVCIAPPVRLGGPTVRTAIVTGLDAARATGGKDADAAGIVHRKGAPPVMVLPNGALAVGDAEGLPAIARAARGVSVTNAEREALIDADVLVRLDLRLLMAQYEADYQAARATLAAAVAQAQQDDAELATIALLQERQRAAGRLWASAEELAALTAGLIVDRRAVDVRGCLALKPESPLGKALADHPPLVGELNPPLPSQEFVALAYASFDPGGAVRMLQWLTDALVDAAVAFRPDAGGIGPAEIEGLRHLFGDFAAILGGRAGLVVSVPKADQPVLQADGIVRLKDPSCGAEWRGRVPAALDGLVYVARAWLRGAAGRGAGMSLRSMLDPSSPRADLPIDRWQLAVEFEGANNGDHAPPPAAQLATSMLGPQGMTLWNTAAGAYGYWSIAPEPSRLQHLMARTRAPQLGRAGDDEHTAEALRHVLRRSNVVAVFSPSVATQLVSIAVLQRFAAPGAGPMDIPLVRARSLAAVSARLAPGSLSARLYIPVTELEPLFSGYRTLQLLERPFVQPAPPKVP